MESDRVSADELLPRVYADLHGLAGRLLRNAGRAPTLQATALVHEAYLRLAGNASGFEGQLHFYRVAARAMRNVLVNYARDRGRIKRGENRERVTLGTGAVAFVSDLAGILDLNAALEELAQRDDELAQIVELRFFSGLTVDETATLMELSPATVERRWRVARALLRHSIHTDDEAAP